MSATGSRRLQELQRRASDAPWISVLILVALATAISFMVFRWLGLADVIMVYMLCITVAAARFGRWPTVLASFLSILTLDFCFIEPRYSFVLTDIQHIGTFGVMAGVGWLILGLVEHIRSQTRQAQTREHQTHILYRVGAVLAEGGSIQALQDRVEAYLSQALAVPVALLLCDTQGHLQPDSRLPPEDLGWAQTFLAPGQSAEWDTPLFPVAQGLFLPMPGTERPMGILALLPAPGALPLESAQREWLLSLASQIALALERASLAEERSAARLKAEHEQLRSTLLSSISHDLRTPLGTITGATTTLLDPGPETCPGDQKVLLNTIHHESRRLLRMVNNLLDITRLESGQVRVNKEWAAIEEVVGSAIRHLEEHFDSRPLTVELPEIWVPMDPVLFEQALFNVLDNALKFSPPGSAIDLRGWAQGAQFFIQVTDDGPGIPAGEEELIFEKLYRGTRGTGISGAGLGLAICKGILLAHDGSIQARTRPQGGAQITLALPLQAETLEGQPAELNF